MYYNIETSGKAQDFLKDFLSLNDDDLRNLVSVVQKRYSDKVFCKIWNEYSDIISTKDISKLKVMLKHVTTSNNECNDIQEHGIFDLKRILSTNSQLTNFLSKNGIEFDFVRKKMFYGNKSIDIGPEYTNSCMISNKIYYDYSINGFLYFNSIKEYNPVIEECPEFLDTLQKQIGEEVHKDLVKLWAKDSETYMIDFWVYTNQINDKNFIEKDDYTDLELDEKTKEYLLDFALLKIHYESYSDYKNIFLKNDLIIPPSQIISCTRLPRTSEI